MTVAVDLRCPPTLVHEPPGRAGSYADDVAEYAENIGRPLTPDQYAAVDVLVAHDRRGRFLSVAAALEGPRQTVGKSGGIMLPIALWTALTDPDSITWTAHLAETSLKQFADLCGKDPDDESGLITSCDWLRRRVRKPVHENGSESVSFRNGSDIAFKVRSPGRSRGMSGNTVIDDEFLFMTAEQVGNQAPVLATRSLHGNARAYRASSAAKKGSDMQRALRRRALAKDPTLTFVGWWAAGGWENPGCASPMCSHEVGSVGCALDDEGLLRTCNPLFANPSETVGVSAEFMRSMRTEMTPLEFGREFAGWEELPDLKGAPPISVDAWKARIDPASAVTDGARVVLAAEIAMDRRSGSVGVAGWRQDGKAHAGLIWRAPGVDADGRPVELVDLLPALLGFIERNELYQLNRGTEEKPKLHPAVIIDPTSPANTLIDPLRRAGVEPVLMTTSEVGISCGGMQDALRDDEVRHRDQPAVDAALAGAVRRDLGDGGWALGRKKSAAQSVDITAAVAVFNARWGLTQAEADTEVWGFFE